MKRASAIVGMAAMLALLAGCSSFDVAGLLFAEREPHTGDYVVTGSVKAVAEASVRSLTRLGMKAEMTPVGESIQITGETKKGSRFVLVLIREESDRTEQTRIQLHWLHRNGDQFDLRILAEGIRAMR